MNSNTFRPELLLLCLLATRLYGQTGLQGEYFKGKNFDQKVLTRTDPQINFVWDFVAPVAGMDPEVFSVRWTGRIKAPETGIYIFRAHVDDGVRVMINGKMVIDNWNLNDSKRFTGEISLLAGRLYDLRVEYFNGMREGEIQLFWRLPSEAPAPDDFIATFDHVVEGRFLSLPAVVPGPVQAGKTPGSEPKPKPLKPGKPVRIAKDTLEKYLPRNILFVQSKSIILPESMPELDRLAGFLARNPAYRLRIEGHTDHIGNAEKNLRLSIERAQTVADYLSGKGIAAHRIMSTGYGDTRPLVQEAPGIPNPVNRRVAFTILE